MISKILKTLFNTGKKAKKSIEDSVDFIDDVLEKEYITSSIENAKEASGKIVEKAGTLYQKSKDGIEDVLDKEKMNQRLEQAKMKGRELTDELTEAMAESSETIKAVMNEGKDFINKVFNDEEE